MVFNKPKNDYLLSFIEKTLLLEKPVETWFVKFVLQTQSENTPLVKVIKWLTN